VAKFGMANTWIFDSDKFELYSDANGKVRFRPAGVDVEPGAAVEPQQSRAEPGVGIASISTDARDALRIGPTEQDLRRLDHDEDGDASN
jgi:hypothetical protein